MFARVFKSTVIVSIVAFLAVANGVPTSTGGSKCNNGQLRCCNQLMTSTSTQAQSLGGLLGSLGLGSIVGNIGLGCLPINVAGVGNAASCNQQVACCEDVMQSGLINLGCSPINVNV